MKKFLKRFAMHILICALTLTSFWGCSNSNPPENEPSTSPPVSESLPSTTIDNSPEDTPATRWEIATTTSDLKGKSGYYTDEKVLRGLHEAGFKYIDFSMYSFARNDVYMSDNWREEALKLKAVADELGMEFVQAHSQGGNPLSSSESEFIVQATIRSIEICEVLGIKNTVVHAGWGSGLSKEEWFAKNKAFYERLLPTAEKCGVNILCENSTAANMGSNYYINTGADMLEFIQYVDHPNFHGCWDTGHANCEPGSQYDDIVTLGDEIYAIHFADNLGNADSHMMPFFGTLDINPIIQALVDIEYDGYFTLECDGKQRNQNTYSGPEFEWIKETYPDVAVSSSPKDMTRIEQEKLLYIIAEHIIKNYPLS